VSQAGYLGRRERRSDKYRDEYPAIRADVAFSDRFDHLSSGQPVSYDVARKYMRILLSIQP
jgi:hypothetical protein